MRKRRKKKKTENRTKGPEEGKGQEVKEAKEKGAKARKQSKISGSDIF